ncbi:hypothetical protein Tco_1046934 [Tanacetum coccineum]
MQLDPGLLPVPFNTSHLENLILRDATLTKKKQQDSGVCSEAELGERVDPQVFRLVDVPTILTLLVVCSEDWDCYQAVELEEDGFNVYFEGGLRNDDNFNAQDYWLSISRVDNLDLSRSHTSTIMNPILRVIHKMITYGLCQRTTRYDKVQKNNLWLLSMFDARHQNGYANVAWAIARWIKEERSWDSERESNLLGHYSKKLLGNACVA